MTLFNNIEQPSYEERIANGETVRALWWKQPFASMMLHGKIETRSRDTKVRGLILICSTLKPYDGFDLSLMCKAEQIRAMNSMLENEVMEDGMALAVGELVSTCQMEPQHEESAYVKYDPM